MDVVHLIVLAVVQGVMEFLPVSSSGHLVLVPLFMDVPDHGLMLDVAAHVGTLFAVIVYFWRDVSGMIVGLGRLLRGRNDPAGYLVGLLIVGTIPVIAVGLALVLLLVTAIGCAACCAYRAEERERARMETEVQLHAKKKENTYLQTRIKESEIQFGAKASP